MHTLAAFLRAINVGGRRVANETLRAAFLAIGFPEAQVFRASGNVVFAADADSSVELVARIEEGLERSLGYAVPIYLRDASEIRRIAAARPFAAELVAASTGKLHVVLLRSRPGAPARKKVLALADERNQLAFGERELYWLPSKGMLESALDRKLIDATVGAVTLRTKNTIEQIAGKYFGG